jgi:uncharacterized protein (TIGR02145 family)
MKTIFFIGLAIFLYTYNAESQIDGNKAYKTVKIGNQEWMSENLNVSTFNNGDKITEAKSSAQWTKLCNEKKPAWCYYDFKAENGKKYGKLYNWFAISDKGGLAPAGWRISTFEDWEILAKFVGGRDIAAKKLKNQTGWKQEGQGTNNFGFNGLPGGSINAYGMFGDIGFWGSWWCYDVPDAKLVKGIYLKHDSDTIEEYASYMKVDGLSVRCVRKNE